jgi:hypothetical protein
MAYGGTNKNWLLGGARVEQHIGKRDSPGKASRVSVVAAEMFKLAVVSDEAPCCSDDPPVGNDQGEHTLRSPCFLDPLLVESDGTRILFQPGRNGQWLIQFGTLCHNPAIAGAHLKKLGVQVGHDHVVVRLPRLGQDATVGIEDHCAFEAKACQCGSRCRPPPRRC